MTDKGYRKARFAMMWWWGIVLVGAALYGYDTWVVPHSGGRAWALFTLLGGVPMFFRKVGAVAEWWSVFSVIAVPVFLLFCVTMGGIYVPLRVAETMLDFWVASRRRHDGAWR